MRRPKCRTYIAKAIREANRVDPQDDEAVDISKRGLAYLKRENADLARQNRELYRKNTLQAEELAALRRQMLSQQDRLSRFLAMGGGGHSYMNGSDA